MSRQDANAAFALTSFLYGGNADYIDKLYARYEADPQAVDAQWQSFFASLKDAEQDVVQNARGASWQRSDWPPVPRGDLISALDADWAEVEKDVGDKVRAKAQAKGVEVSPGDVQQATRDSVRALMLIRAYRMRGPPARQSRSARPRARARPRRARSALLWLQRRGFRPQDLPRPRARARIRHAAADRDHPPAHLLPDPRRRVHAHLRPAAEGLDSGAHRRARQGDHLHPRRQARDPAEAGRGGGVREVLRRQIHRHQAVRARRRRSR